MANAVERLSLLKVSKRSGGHAMSNRATQGSTGLLRRQIDGSFQGESRARSLYCAFHGKGKAGHGKWLRNGEFEWCQEALDSRGGL